MSQNLSRRKRIKLVHNCTHNFADYSSSKINNPNLALIKQEQNLQSFEKNKMAIADGDDERKVREIEVEYLETPVKPESDQKEYRYY